MRYFNPVGLVGLVGFVCLASAPPSFAAMPPGTDVSEQTRQLVEADWLRQDGEKALSPDHIADLLNRAEALAARLHVSKDFAERLDACKNDLAAIEKTKDAPESDRKSLYSRVRGTLREIAFRNPLLQEIDKLLFIKQHQPTGVYHMCDQFYGCNAVAGGGLYVLVDPFGDGPKLVDLLENATVENGRLQGRKLTGGFLSPEVSFDGTTILFAHSECGATDTYQWTKECCFHLFQVNADGTGLRQLTDGIKDDFDPCFLPGGRIAFISLRRGGYLRCGRHCPTYTLYSMEPDGSDIVCLSFHETHEWQPSVDHDGMLVYTRWDYVDRDTNVAHHIWTCYPDGRDPRSFHGNYPEKRETRPWMEMDIRAIPGSHKYVATAGAHHGNALGSLVLIDRREQDNLEMSQLTRLTPKTPFPEAEGGKQNIAKLSRYGTPWPLSEKDFLCVYDVNAVNHGIYWIDADGNKELVYRDPAIRCMSPMPLTPRPMPPVIPTATTQFASAKDQDRPATIAVMNIYDADFEWPEGTVIKELRIIQVLPKTTPAPNDPRIGIGNQAGARAVLGTVPVEEDGSVFFEAPVGKAIYFQALDASGMAVQSMRSVTYVHPGEQLTCQGCHERKLRSVGQSLNTPKALLREPSNIRPEPEGSNPFSYVRLVQPVLDAKCVECHRQKEAVDLTGEPAGDFGWTRSYHNLAEKFGYYFDSTNGSIARDGSRTVPGGFGAKGALLLPYIRGEHYGVQLTEEERRRITLWLDANSDFFGAYEETQAQTAGKIVVPALD